jgi:phage terminase small subunit
MQSKSPGSPASPRRRQRPLLAHRPCAALWVGAGKPNVTQRVTKAKKAAAKAALKKANAVRLARARLKEVLFVEAYLANGGNGAQAAIAAGYDPTNARLRASRLLAKVNVGQRIADRQAERIAKAKASSDEVLVNLARAHRFTVADLFDKHGRPVRLEDLNENARAALQMEAVEVIEEEQPAPKDGKPAKNSGATTRHLKVVRMRQRDPNVIAEQLNKHLGHYERDNRQRTPRAVAIGRLTVGPMDFDEVHPRAPRIPEDKD